MKPVTVCALLTALCVPAAASAYEQGDVLLRAGATSIQPDDSGKPDDVWADDATGLGLNAVYMASDNVGIELLLSAPFKHDIKAKGSGKVGSTKLLPPTLSVQYYFANSSLVTPYVGAGINYTVFFGETIDAPGYDNIELKNSTGAAIQAGADFAINDNWGVNLDIRWIDIDTEVDSVPAGDPLDANGAEVQIDPVVYSLTAVYKF